MLFDDVVMVWVEGLLVGGILEKFKIIVMWDDVVNYEELMLLVWLVVIG